MSFTLHALRTFTSRLNFMLSSTCVRICYPYLFPTMIRRNVEMFTECSSLFRGDPWLLTYDVRTDCCLVVVGILHYFIREWLGLWVDNSAMRHECDMLDIELRHLYHLSKRTFSWWGWRERHTNMETVGNKNAKNVPLYLFSRQSKTASSWKHITNRFFSSPEVQNYPCKWCRRWQRQSKLMFRQCFRFIFTNILWICLAFIWKDHILLLEKHLCQCHQIFPSWKN